MVAEVATGEAVRISRAACSSSRRAAGVSGADSVPSARRRAATSRASRPEPKVPEGLGDEGEADENSPFAAGGGGIGRAEDCISISSSISGPPLSSRFCPPVMGDTLGDICPTASGTFVPELRARCPDFFRLAMARALAELPLCRSKLTKQRAPSVPVSQPTWRSAEAKRRWLVSRSTKASVIGRASPFSLLRLAQPQRRRSLPTTASWSTRRCVAMATTSGLSGVVISILIQSPLIGGKGEKGGKN